MEVSAHCHCYKSLVLPKLPPHAAHAALSHVVAFRQRSSSINITSPQLLRLQRQRQRQPLLFSIKPKSKNHPTIYAASSSSSVQTPPDKWLLEPVGDGDSRHIGFKVPMPNAFEISSNEVTVGRLPEKADMVIPVATVSGVHARIQKKEGKLLVTDLDSTNGTFIDDKRLSAGVVATVPPGSCLTFGDEHLAVFRVSKLENVEAASNPDPSQDKVETDIPIESTTS